MEPEKRPPGVMLYFDKMRLILALLSNAERGELFMKILDYAEYGEVPDFVFGERLESLWPYVRKALDLDAAAYREKCERARKAAQARWEREHGGKPQEKDGP